MVFFAFLGQLHLCQNDSCKRSALVMDTSSVSYMVITKNPFSTLTGKETSPSTFSAELKHQRECKRQLVDSTCIFCKVHQN